MLRKLFVFCVLIAVVYCQSTGIKHHVLYKKKKHHKGYHHLLLHGLSTLSFLAVKVKVILVVATIFIGLCIGGKVFAFLKYLDHKKEHDHGPIYIQAPSHHGHSFETIGDAGGFSEYSADRGGFSVDQPPPNAEYASSYGEKNGQWSGRSSSDEEDRSIYDDFDLFARSIRMMNLTDTAFNEMNITTIDCKKKIVCEADFNAKGSTILKAGLDLISDDTYSTYKTNETVNNFEECAALYPNCHVTEQDH